MKTEKLQIAAWVKSKTDLGGTVCGKSARTGLWGSGEVTNRSTRKAPQQNIFATLPLILKIDTSLTMNLDLQLFVHIFVQNLVL